MPGSDGLGQRADDAGWTFAFRRPVVVCEELSLRLSGSRRVVLARSAVVELCLTRSSE